MMIHTYKRKRASLKSCSFHERLCGDSLAECSALTKPKEDSILNDWCCSRETEEASEAKCEAWFSSDMPKKSVLPQPPPLEQYEAPPIKFKYTRRPKEICSSCSSLRHVAALQLIHKANERMPEANTMRTDSDQIGCISCQSKVSHVYQNPDIPDQDVRPCIGRPSPGEPDEITDKCLDPSKNAESLCDDSCSHSHCIDSATHDARQPYSGSPDLNIRGGGSFPSRLSNKDDNASSRVCTNISSETYIESGAGVSMMHAPDFKTRDETDACSNQTCHDIVKTKCDAPLLTYIRRSRKDEDAHRIYADLLAERNNYSVSDENISGSTGSHTDKAMPKEIDLGNSEIILVNSPSFSLSLDKLDAGVSAVSAMVPSQGNQKVRNGCQFIDNALNEEAVTGQQSDDAIKHHHNICDLTLHTAYEKASTAVAMQDTFISALVNPQIHSNEQEKAGVASKDFSDKPEDVDVNLAERTKCREEAVILQSKSLEHCLESNHFAHSDKEVLRTSHKELSENMTGVNMGSNGLPDTNVQPPKDTGSVSQRKETVYPAALPNGSAHNQVLQLFPEGNTDHAHLHGSSSTGLVPAVTSNNNSVSMALPDLSIGCPEFIQDTNFEPSSSQAQARRKLLLDSIRSLNKPPIGARESFHQNFQPFTAFWSEEELDNLWVGVRRHGKDNWYEMLRDPKLRFAPWRTAKDLAEKWVMEQTKLLGISPVPQSQSAKPLGIPLDNSYRSSVPHFVPPDAGFMTRFLTDPTQLSLSNAYLTNQCQGMFPPRPPQSFTDAPGNRTRLFNHRVKAHRRSQYDENSWERFKARNLVMSPPRLLTPVPTTSRNDVLPSGVTDTFGYLHPLPPLPIPSLSIPHSGTLSPFRVELNNKNGVHSRRNGMHSSSTIVARPDLALTTAQPCEPNPTDPKRPQELINLESDASSEETISDDDTRPVCK